MKFNIVDVIMVKKARKKRKNIIHLKSIEMLVNKSFVKIKIKRHSIC